MGLRGKLTAEFEVKSSAEDFHQQLRHKPHRISSFSDLVHDCQLHGGQFGQPGVTICWRYNDPDGKPISCKQTMEFHEDTKTIVYTVVGGELLDVYKTMVITLELVATIAELNIWRWTIDYEKLHKDAPHPCSTLDVILNVSRHIEIEHVKKAAK